MVSPIYRLRNEYFQRALLWLLHRNFHAMPEWNGIPSLSSTTHFVKCWTDFPNKAYYIYIVTNINFSEVLLLTEDFFTWGTGSALNAQCNSVISWVKSVILSCGLIGFSLEDRFSCSYPKSQAPHTKEKCLQRKQILLKIYPWTRTTTLTPQHRWSKGCSWK